MSKIQIKQFNMHSNTNKYHKSITTKYLRLNLIITYLKI